MQAPRRKNLFRLLFAGLAALMLSGCEAVFFSAMNGVAHHDGVIEHHDIVFEPAHDVALDVYSPARAKHAPVVVFFYGGAWQDGKRQWYRWVGRRLAEQGVVAVVPDYRKYPQVKLDGFMHDAAEAVGWTHANIQRFGGDPNDLFVMGHSSGAHLAAMLASNAHWLEQVEMRPRQLRGFIGLSGPYDFLPLRQQVYINMFGDTHQQQMRSQPVDFVNGDEPPMLLLQGGDDKTVYPDNTLSLAAAMHKQGESVTAHVYPGVTHAGMLLSLSRPFHGKAPRSMHAVLKFIDTHATDARMPPSTH